MAKKLQYGMVGGGPGSFIGGAHRKAIAISGKANLVAGCFSSKMEKSLKTAEELDIAQERTYCDFKEMAKAEAGKLDFVVIATPNNTHYACSKAFLEAGINVMCEKPLCFEIAEAEELVALAKEKDLFFGVMYGYTGNFWCSQVATSYRNGLALRVFGDKGMIEWHEEDCEYLTFCAKGEAPQKMARNCGYVYGRAAEVARIPSGHPEGFYESFANIYDSFCSAIAKKKAGEPLTESDLDFQKAEDGLAGVKYLHAVIDSGKNDSAWRKV